MRLHLHEWGDPAAPALVCLHGVTAHGRRFRRLAEERMAARFRVIAPDLRGHGRSDWEPPWALAPLVADVVETLDALGVARAAFVGHSLGGRLLLDLAARAPERLDRLVLLDPAIQLLPHVAFDLAENERRERAFASPEEAAQAWDDAAPWTPRAAIDEDVAEHVERRDGAYRYRYCQSAVVALYGELAGEPPAPETLRAPTLLVTARDFGLVREEQASDYAAALGDRLTVVHVAGGHNVLWDAWDETAAAVEEFLS